MLITLFVIINNMKNFLEDNWFAVGIGILVAMVAVMLLFRSGNRWIIFEKECDSHKWFSIRSAPVGCYKYFGIGPGIITE